MEVITLEIDDDGCGRLQFELPADATDADVAYISPARGRARWEINFGGASTCGISNCCTKLQDSGLR